MDLQLTGRRAVVTGGTRGIGRAIVETLLAEGASVAFCARDERGVAEAEAELTAASAQTVSGTSLDVADAAALSTWVSDSARRLGGIDIVVANVSAMQSQDTEETWARCVQVDLMGTVRLVQAALPHLEQSDAASIITLSSVSGREIDAFEGPYGAVKAAVVHYTQGIAHRLAPKGIRANTVSPGNTLFEGGSWAANKRDSPEFFQASLDLIPAGRMGTAQEMANAVVFLASPASSFTSGANLVVDGALTRGVQL
jgi:3-oxoacyl-[acyl-carrier protein] reductase